ncbi:MAG: hypothetical protein IPQ27_02665 [Chitinophagaceae bacterium]|nr:hypothetical protein [Chitinophagaceae bacterium]
MPIPWQDEPSSFDPNNPCNVVDSLLKTTAFPILLHKLRDSTINNYEIGYSQVNTLSPANYSETYFSGQNEVDALAVNVVLNNSSDGVAHNHYNSPDRLHNFSAEDIYKLAYYWSIGKINNLSNFSYTVVTDSTSYILMIDDPAALYLLHSPGLIVRRISIFSKFIFIEIIIMENKEIQLQKMKRHF